MVLNSKKGVSFKLVVGLVIILLILVFVLMTWLPISSEIPEETEAGFEASGSVEKPKERYSIEIIGMQPVNSVELTLLVWEVNSQTIAEELRATDFAIELDNKLMVPIEVEKRSNGEYSIHFEEGDLEEGEHNIKITVFDNSSIFFSATTQIFTVDANGDFILPIEDCFNGLDDDGDDLIDFDDFGNCQCTPPPTEGSIWTINERVQLCSDEVYDVYQIFLEPTGRGVILDCDGASIVGPATWGLPLSVDDLRPAVHLTDSGVLRSEIKNCKFTNFYIALSVENQKNVLIENNEFFDNFDGLKVQLSEDVVINRNEFRGHLGTALIASGLKNSDITNNKVKGVLREKQRPTLPDYLAGLGISVGSMVGGSVAENEVSMCVSGLSIGSLEGTKIENNLVTQNDVGLSVTENIPADKQSGEFSGNSFCSVEVDMIMRTLLPKENFVENACSKARRYSWQGGNDVSDDYCGEKPCTPPFGDEFLCNNRLDDDADGLPDCLDPDCTGTWTCEHYPEGCVTPEQLNVYRPKFEDQGYLSTYTIGNPTHDLWYELLEGITLCEGETYKLRAPITISGVDKAYLNCNGATLKPDPDPVYTLSRAITVDSDYVSVFDCNIEGFKSGMVIDSNYGKVHDNTLSKFSEIKGNARGISASGYGIEVVDNVILGSGGTGIYLTAAEQSVVTRNEACFSEDWDISSSSPPLSTLAGNTCSEYTTSDNRNPCSMGCADDEICEDGIDNDRDGEVDEADCREAVPPTVEFFQIGWYPGLTYSPEDYTDRQRIIRDFSIGGLAEFGRYDLSDATRFFDDDAALNMRVEITDDRDTEYFCNAFPHELVSVEVVDSASGQKKPGVVVNRKQVYDYMADAINPELRFRSYTFGANKIVDATTNDEVELDLRWHGWDRCGNYGFRGTSTYFLSFYPTSEDLGETFTLRVSAVDRDGFRTTKELDITFAESEEEA